MRTCLILFLLINFCNVYSVEKAKELIAAKILKQYPEYGLNLNKMEQQGNFLIFKLNPKKLSFPEKQIIVFYDKNTRKITTGINVQTGDDKPNQPNDDDIESLGIFLPCSII